MLSEEEINQVSGIAVRIASKGKILGSGFWVTANHLVTCHHVIKDREAGTIDIYFNDEKFPVTSLHLPADTNILDLAILYIASPPAAVNVLTLQDGVHLNQLLYTYGYTEKYFNGRSATFYYEGPAENNALYYQLKAGQAVPGLSGSLLLNVETGNICGVLCKTRDKDTDIGGYGIPVRLLFSAFPLLKALNQQQGISLYHYRFYRACEQMLTKQKQLSSNLFTLADGNKFEISQIYTSMYLEKDAAPQREKEAESGTAATPAEKEKTVNSLSDDAFFAAVLQLLRKADRRPVRIMLTGNPGSGKTTVLQHLAWLAIASKELYPVWISLSDLQERSIDKYLAEDWLPRALQSTTIPQHLKDGFEQLFRDGKVLLLLDGLDETSGYESLANQLQSWPGKAIIIGTCRTGVWQIIKNGFFDFETYRLHDFTIGEEASNNQAGQFIEAWFADKPQLAASLLQKLNEAGLEKIKDAATNPLMLAILCNIWARGAGDLPPTRAGLYAQLVNVVYGWKKKWGKQLGKKAAYELSMNKFLGKIALQALDQPTPQYLLTHPVLPASVEEEEWELLDEATEMGFLNNRGGMAAEPNRYVYSFFHSTIQEYFAALAVPDSHFFFHHVPGDRSAGNYRIFDESWLIVAQLWMGLSDNTKKTARENLFNHLAAFNDDCGGFYNDKAFLLSVLLQQDCPDCVNEVSDSLRIYNWAFGIIMELDEATDKLIPKPVRYFSTLQSSAREVLFQLRTENAIDMLLGFYDLAFKNGLRTRYQIICEVIGRVAVNHKKTIDHLIPVILYLVHNGKSEHGHLLIDSLDALLAIGTKDNDAIKTMAAIMKEPLEQLNVYRRILNILEGSAALDPLAETEFKNIIQSLPFDKFYQYEFDSNKKFAKYVAAAAINKLRKKKKRLTHRYVISHILQAFPDNEELINLIVEEGKKVSALNDKLAITELLAPVTTRSTSLYDYLCRQVAAMDDSETLRAYLIKEKTYPFQLKLLSIRSIVILLRIAPNEVSFIDKLKAFFDLDEIGNFYYLVSSIEDPDGHYRNFLSLPYNLFSFFDMAFRALEEIAPLTQKTRDLFETLLTHSDEGVRYHSARILLKQDNTHPKAIQTLIDLLGNYNNPESQRREMPYRALETLKDYAYDQTVVLNKFSVLLSNERDLRNQTQLVQMLGRLCRHNAAALDLILNHSPNVTDPNFLFAKVVAFQDIGIADKRIVRKIGEWFPRLISPSTAIDAIEKLGYGFPESLDLLSTIIKDQDSRPDIKISALKTISRLGTGNEQVLQLLLECMENYIDSEKPSFQNLVYDYADAICALIRKEFCEKIIRALKITYLQTGSYERREAYYSILWKCASTIPYAEFHHYWNN